MSIATISNSLAKHIVIDDNKDDLELISYGLEGIISSVLNTLVALLISLLTGNTLQMLMLCITFIPIRCMHKGIHCKSFSSCLINSNIMILLATYILKMMTFTNWMYLIIIIAVIMQYSISIEKNKPLNCAIVICFFLVSIFYNPIACSILLSVILNLVLILGRRLHEK